MKQVGKITLLVVALVTLLYFYYIDDKMKRKDFILMGNVALGELNVEPGQKQLQVQLATDFVFIIDLGRTLGACGQNATANDDMLRLHWPDTNSTLTVTRNEYDKLIEFVVSWSSNTQYSLEDAIHLHGCHWYGGSETWGQKFPIESLQFGVTPYVTSDIYQSIFGDVMERYWLSSRLVAIIVDQQLPLWVGMNENGNSLLVLRSQHKDSVYANFVDLTTTRPALTYKIVTAKERMPLKDFHLNCMTKYFGLPKGIPDERMIAKPIWSTWARYKKEINQSKVIEFAKEIKDNGFENSQLEIDDEWSTNYGDLIFDPKKFPDPKQMTDELKELGYRTTIWVNPFASPTSKVANDKNNEHNFLKQPSGKRVWCQWWNGVGLTLDPTNDSAANWFVGRLENFRQTNGLNSFKFDAGEVNWLSDCFRYSTGTYPNWYSKKYAEMAARLGDGIEVRVGSGTQHLPVFVRVMDKDSRWGYDNGLKAMITSVLNLSVLGYPFSLPDMIGGNAYEEEGPDTNPDTQTKPDRELFIRWIQANTFLPAVQFSITPWQYDQEVTEICTKMMNLRNNWTDYIISVAKQCTVTGEPIIRPLWFADESESALSCDSQYLVGDKVLVAPVLDPGVTKRTVYLPHGAWKSGLNDGIYEGNRHIEIDVPLESLAYFVRQ